MDKKEGKKSQNPFAEKELTEFKKGLPLDENIFPELFDFLDTELGKNDCNHTASLTRAFLERQNISNITEVIAWLSDNGGFCDCEILANVEELFEYLNPPQNKPIPKKEIKKQKLSGLKTNFGFRMDNIPSPWTLTETISTDGNVHNFQIGRSNNCVVNLSADFPINQFANDRFWVDQWIKETELDYNIDDLTVDRLEFENYFAIVVKTKNWTPVKIWCIRKDVDKWFLKMTTELSRHKGDIKELEKLMNNIRVD